MTKSQPAKVGTIPRQVVVDGRSKLAINKRVRFRYNDEPYRWRWGIVTKLDPILFLTLI